MPVFVHLTPEKNIQSIIKNGLRFRKINGIKLNGIYAMPVTRNFYVSHQWLRELRRNGQRSWVGVYFRIADDEEILVGHYSSSLVAMTAAQAAALISGVQDNVPTLARENDKKSNAVQRGKRPPSSPEGYQVIISRPIEKAEILRIRHLPQVLGWRYSPGAHERPPCVCLCCERGSYGISKLKKAVEKAEVQNKQSKIIMFGRLK